MIINIIYLISILINAQAYIFRKIYLLEEKKRKGGGVDDISL